VGYRLNEHRERIEDGITTGEEMVVTSFLQNEIEVLFPELRSFGTRVSEAVATYERSMDPAKRTVYRQRRDFEESVSLFNERLASYLDAEEAEAQAIFPHYFDKRQTDGLDYVIYLGASMVENGAFHELYVHNLRIWQIIVGCGLAWHADQLRSMLKVPLRSTHLILVNHNPLAIRFRFEEKRFDDWAAVLFDQAISPAQQRNLERVLGVPVADRTALILEIFAARAQSHEGKLQVELARPLKCCDEVGPGEVVAAFTQPVQNHQAVHERFARRAQRQWKCPVQGIVIITEQDHHGQERTCDAITRYAGIRDKFLCGAGRRHAAQHGDGAIAARGGRPRIPAQRGATVPHRANGAPAKAMEAGGRGA